MGTMQEMIREYRAAAAKLAMRIQEKKAAGAPETEVSALQDALQDVRAACREMVRYYDR